MDPSARLWVNVTINQQPACLLFDTGADGAYLFRPAAERLKLSMQDVPANLRATNMAGAFFKETEKCQTTFFNGKFDLRFGVLNAPRWTYKMDGLLGWPVFQDSIFEIRAAGTNTSVRFLNSRPRNTKGWTRVALRSKSRQLFLEMPDGRRTISVFLDTGNPAGICLSPIRWQQWRQANPQAQRTLVPFLTINSPLPIAEEESLAAKFSFGSLSFTNVPLLEDKDALRTGHELTLGMAALARMDVIIDGKHSRAYLRPRNTPAEPYLHNRAGVVFLIGSLENPDGAAHVIAGSPADEAGVQDGDILMKCDGKWRTNWTENPNDTFCRRPAGTKIELVLKRGGKMVNATVTLRDILSTGS